MPVIIGFAQTFNDLVSVPLLGVKLYRKERTARCGAAGTSSTVVLDASASAVDDFYNGDYVFLLQGAGGPATVGLRTITDYVGSSKVATVSPEWGAGEIPLSTNDFTIVRVSSHTYSAGPPKTLSGWTAAPGTDMQCMNAYFDRTYQKHDNAGALVTARYKNTMSQWDYYWWSPTEGVGAGIAGDPPVDAENKLGPMAGKAEFYRSWVIAFEDRTF